MWKHTVTVETVSTYIQRIKYVTICVLLVHFTSSMLHGATFIWDGQGGPNTNWSTKQNWTNNTTPSGTGHDLYFAGSSRLENINDVLTRVKSITFNSTAESFTLTNDASISSLSLTGNVTNSSANLQTINMALGLSVTDFTLAAASGSVSIGGIISGSSNFNKTGIHQLILSGANTYTGTTTVSAGTLLANNSTGSATGTGSMVVNASGTLGGTGIITPGTGRNVSVSGKISPGSGTTPGTLTINLSATTGGVTMNSGAGFEFHLGSAGVGDMLAIASASAGDVAFNNNNINFMGTGAAGNYKLFDTSSNNSNTWTGLTINVGGQITGGLTYSGLAGGYSATLFMGGGSYGGDNGDIYVQVVPEPSVALMGGLGVLGLVLRRRRPSH